MKTLILGLMLLAQTQPPAATQPPPAAPQPAPSTSAAQVEEGYVVGVGDVLSVKVFGEDPMSRDRIPVEADGTIDVAEIGPMKVAGRTTRQIQQLIEEEYRKRNILLKPNVAVAVQEFRSQMVWVTGEVKRPAGIPLKGDLSLLAALQGVDYYTSDAGHVIQIFRARPGESTAAPAILTDRKPDLQVSREDVASGRAGHIRLQDGDNVYVPRAPTFFISGEVKNAGELTIRPGLTVWDAVMSLAGGPTQYAARNRITVSRLVNGEWKEFKPRDLKKELVQAGDRIFVPRRRI